MLDEIVTLDYGSGGEKTAALIEEVFLPAFSNDALRALGDGALVSGAENLCFSTDSFVIDPLFFPGGDIGKLCVCGTVNDLLVSGAQPLYLSLSAIIEEGFSTEKLKRIVQSAAETARRANVSIVTGDTKVVPRGRGDGVYLNTAGIGRVGRGDLCPDAIREGDVVLVSGDVGRHGMSVMLARHELGLSGEVPSDCAPLCEIAPKLWELPTLRVLRDPTRGGLATTLCEFAERRPFSIELDEAAIPIDLAVLAACEMLGIDPLYSACEGRLIAVVAPDDAGAALKIMKNAQGGTQAAIIGRVKREHAGHVILRTALGAGRILPRLAGAQLPRIC